VCVCVVCVRARGERGRMRKGRDVSYPHVIRAKRVERVRGEEGGGEKGAYLHSFLIFFVRNVFSLVMTRVYDK